MIHVCNNFKKMCNNESSCWFVNYDEEENDVEGDTNLENNICCVLILRGAVNTIFRFCYTTRLFCVAHLS